MEKWFGNACGNSFLVIRKHDENNDEIFGYIEELRRFKQWDFDSILFISQERDGIVDMRIIERDGSESSMCGNGARVIAHIMQLSDKRLFIRSGENIVSVVKGNGHKTYRVHFDDITTGRSFRLRDNHFTAPFRFDTHVIQGEPHAVAWVDDVLQVPLTEWGSAIVPESNCTVVSHRNGEIYARTFERGVNRETDSCGTGACAAAYALYAKGIVKGGKFTVRMNTHELRVEVTKEGCILEGSASAKPLSDVFTTQGE